MKIYLLRHGLTVYNTEKRYQGVQDIPLSDEGRAQLVKADFCPDVVYVSPLGRARDTANILFPHSRQVIVENLKEMDFGVFEGRNYLEMENDPEYRAWVESGCELVCPGGESKAEFSNRCCAAFEQLADRAFDAGEEILVIMAHGGTQMAVMERYALPHREYYSWCGPNGGGYLLEGDTTVWKKERRLQLLQTVQYTRQEGGKE